MDIQQRKVSEVQHAGECVLDLVMNDEHMNELSEKAVYAELSRMGITVTLEDEKASGTLLYWELKTTWNARVLAEAIIALRRF